MLNPSTADASNDDKTINKCINYAEKLDCGSIEVVNLFSWRSRHKSEIRANESIGKDNDTYIVNCAQNSDIIICAWGNEGKYKNRSNEIKTLLKSKYYKLNCLKLSKKGEPRHPLYLKKEISLQQI